jgi:kynurenine formamidase
MISMAERIIDLTLEIEHDMPTHKAFERPVYQPYTSHVTTLSEGFGTPEDPFTSAINQMSFVEHVGTHVDAFYHFDPNGLTIDQMPITMFYGKAVCFDLTYVPDLGVIDVADLEEAEKKTGIKVDGHIVLLNTGLHKRHYPNSEVMHTNPGITAAATHWLADRGSKLHGVEGPSTDLPSDKLFINHRTCRDRGISHYEWLVNLEQLVDKGEFMFYGIPLKLKKGTGSPVRAYAIVQE